MRGRFETLFATIGLDYVMNLHSTRAASIMLSYPAVCGVRPSKMSSLPKSKKSFIGIWFVFAVVAAAGDLLLRLCWGAEHYSSLPPLWQEVSVFFKSGEYLVVALAVVAAGAWEVTRKTHICMDPANPEFGHDDKQGLVRRLVWVGISTAIILFMSSSLFFNVLDNEMNPKSYHGPSLYFASLYLLGTIATACAWVVMTERSKGAT